MIGRFFAGPILYYGIDPAFFMFSNLFFILRHPNAVVFWLKVKWKLPYMDANQLGTLLDFETSIWAPIGSLATVDDFVTSLLAPIGFIGDVFTFSGLHWSDIVLLSLIAVSPANLAGGKSAVQFYKCYS